MLNTKIQYYTVTIYDQASKTEAHRLSHGPTPLSFQSQAKNMTSYDNDPWLICRWCGEWERNNYHTDMPGIGLLCLRCQHFGPPHFEYLLGLRINERLLLRTDAFAKLAFTAHHLVIKIASFAYKPCAITELSALEYGFANKGELECEFCDKSWTGWDCRHCFKKS